MTKQCNRCLMTDDILGVTIGESGQCNLCDMHDSLEKQYPISLENLEATFDRIKKRGKHHLYDCLVGISGGIDSTYMLYLCHVYGVRAFAFHFDNGFNTEQSECNMKSILAHTGFKNKRYRIDPETWQKVNTAVLMAGVSDADIPNDIAMAKLMLDVAYWKDCPTILNGHNFRTEGSVPIGWTYMDGRYLKDMYLKYWGNKMPKDFPILTVWDQIKASLRGIKHERPLYHSGLTKREQVNVIRAAGIYFVEYNGHHAENDYTSFAGWMTWVRYDIDKRKIVLSAWIRSGRVTKREANIQLSEPPVKPERACNTVITNFDLSPFEQSKIAWYERHMFYEFKTYQKIFRRLRWLVKIAVKLGFLPETFYKKYTQKIKA